MLSILLAISLSDNEGKTLKKKLAILQRAMYYSLNQTGQSSRCT
ncbi:hypothetical protein ACOBV9_21435 (plasmid) [Pseudoalteromonas espejiana]